MSSQVQELIDKIKSEGVLEAQQKAKTIEEQAKAQAHKIIEEAKREKERLIHQAQEDDEIPRRQKDF